jgi:hypothetical protein
MPVRIAPLDYRGTQANLDSQTTNINTFLADKTVTQVAVCDEFIMVHHTNAPLIGLPTKVKIFNLSDAVQANGIPAVETAINDFINSNVTSSPQAPITLDSGFIVLVYK